MTSITTSALIIRLGQKVRALRKDRQMTQVQLAQKANIQRPYLSLIENSHKTRVEDIKLLTVEALAQALDVTVESLLKE